MSNPTSNNIGLSDAFTHAEPDEQTIRQADAYQSGRISPESGPSAGSGQRPSILKRPDSRQSCTSSAKAVVSNIVDACVIETISKVDSAPLSQNLSNGSAGAVGNGAPRRSPSPGQVSGNSHRSQERSVSQPVSQPLDDMEVEDFEDEEVDAEHSNLPTVREWRSTNAQFNAKIRTFTMDVNRIVNGRLSSGGHDMQQEQLDIQGAAEKIEHDRSGWEGKVWGDLRTIRKNAGDIAVALEPSEFAAEELELQIANFKEGNREDYTKLSSLEEELTEGLNTLSQTVDKWNVFKPSAPWRSHLGKVDATPRPLPPPTTKFKHVTAESIKEMDEIKEMIDALDAEIEYEGGMHGGWQRGDHEIFLSIFRNFRSGLTDPRFFERCAFLLPHIERDVITNHVTWNENHEKRMKLKRELLAKWRRNRQNKTRELEAKAAANSATAGQAVVLQDATNPRGAANRIKVQEWKKKKSQEALELARAKAQVEAAERKQRSIAANKHTAKRQEVDAWRLQQKQEEEAAKMHEKVKAAPRHQRSIDEQRRIAERNAAMFEEHKRRAEVARQVPARQRFAIQEQQRLKKGTAAAEGKLFDKYEEHVMRQRELTEKENYHEDSKYGVIAGSFAGKVSQPSLRTIPSWRRN